MSLHLSTEGEAKGDGAQARTGGQARNPDAGPVSGQDGTGSLASSTVDALLAWNDGDVALDGATVATQSGGTNTATPVEQDGEVDADESDGDDTIEQITAVCEQIEATFESIKSGIGQLTGSAASRFTRSFEALKKDMTSAEKLMDYKVALESFRSIEQRACSTLASVQDETAEILRKQEIEDGKPEREELNAQALAALEKMKTAYIAAMVLNLDTGDVGQQFVSLGTRRSGAMSLSSKLSQADRIAALVDVAKTAEATAADLERQVQNVKSAAAARQVLNDKITLALNQIDSGTSAAKRLAVDTHVFEEQRAILAAALQNAMDMSGTMTQEDRVATLEGTLSKAEAMAADLHRVVEDATSVKAARDALNEKVEAAIEQMHDEMTAARRLFVKTQGFEEQEKQLRAARKNANDLSTGMADVDRTASLEDTRKKAEAAGTELRRLAEEAGSAAAACEILDAKVVSSLDQMFTETLAAKSFSLNAQAFEGRREQLHALRKSAGNMSNDMTSAARISSLEDILTRSETAVAELRRLVEDAKSAQAEREAEQAAREIVSERVKASIEQIHSTILLAIPLNLKTASFTERANSLEADRKAAMDTSTAMTQDQRLASLEDTDVEANQAATELRRLVTLAPPADEMIKALNALIEDFEKQHSGLGDEGLIDSHTDLVVRRKAAANESNPSACAMSLEAIADDAREALAAGRAAFEKQPAAAEIRKRVGEPLKTLRADLATLKALDGVDTADVEALVATIEESLSTAKELLDPRQAADAADGIVAALREAQARLDTKKSDGGAVAKLEDDTDGSVLKCTAMCDPLKGMGLDMTAMSQVGTELSARFDEAINLTDAKERFEALARIKRAADEALERAEALTEVADKVTNDGERAPNEDEKLEIYKGALEKLYGLKIVIPEGFRETYLGAVFDMFGMVPKEFVAHGRLKKLSYDETKEEGGSYDKRYAEIVMEKFPDPGATDPFRVGGETIPVNSFKVTTLHEIGHSVDRLHGIMAAAMGGAGNGGWRAHTVDDVAPIFVMDLKEIPDFPKDVDDSVLAGTVTAALKSGSVKRPDGVGDAGWTVIETFLNTKCLAIRANAKPWDNARDSIKVDNRVYVESVQDKWFSYDAGARAESFVSDYQWRSPGEWFSELFAITLFKNTTAPSGFGATIAKYLWPPPGTA